ncbi:MAG: hypothetical protein C7N36_14780 [Bacteroidetes bacterium]|nr:MAG: hypothetical protein C7N36_14780 [Bacteroidota bacterium]
MLVQPRRGFPIQPSAHVYALATTAAYTSTAHHTAQLNMLLRQDFDKHMEWSFRAGDIKNLASV